MGLRGCCVPGFVWVLHRCVLNGQREGGVAGGRWTNTGREQGREGERREIRRKEGGREGLKDGWMARWMDGWTDRGMDGQMGWMDG